MAVDRQNGIRPLPLYELTESDWELFLSGRRIDDVEERLKGLRNFPILFPSARSDRTWIRGQKFRANKDYCVCN